MITLKTITKDFKTETYKLVGSDDRVFAEISFETVSRLEGSKGLILDFIKILLDEANRESKVPKFRSPAGIVEALQFVSNTTAYDIKDWMRDNPRDSWVIDPESGKIWGIKINTPLGLEVANMNDWIVKDYDGQFNVVKASDFNRKYQRIFS